MNTFSRLALLSISIAAVLLLSSCSARNADKKTETDVAPLPCLVLLPTSVPYDEQDTVDGEFQDLHAGALYLDKVLREELEDSTVPRIVETAQLRLEIDELAGSTNGIIDDIARESQCRYILETTLSRYMQRQGGEFAVDSPASAAFDMKLIDAVTGKSLWTTTFSETQRSLMSNLFTFGKAKSRGFRWITVEELAAQGVREKLKGCPCFH